jgi:hypothetical protein
MTRKFSAQRLTELTQITKEHRGWARESYARFRKKLEDLEKDKSRYSSSYFGELKAEITQTALSNIRLYFEELRDELAPALAEKGLHERAAYLLDSRVVDEVLAKDKSKDGRLLRAIEEMNHGLRELTLSARVARLSDEQLASRAQIAVQMNDTQLAAVCLDEANARPSGLVKVQVETALKDIAVPETEIASTFFDQAEIALREMEALAQLVKDPTDQGAYAVIRSREISEARAEREATERKAKEDAAAEQKVKDLEKRKQQAREYIAKGAPIPTPEKVPSIAEQMAKKEAELQANWKTYQQPGNGKTEGGDEPPQAA